MHQIYVTGHALERYREHFPGASSDDVLDSLSAARRIETDEAMIIIAKPGKERNRAIFFVEKEYNGMFIISTDEEEPWPVASYLRFSDTRQKFARKFLEE